MRITRFPSISEQQFLGCCAAFVDTLAGELNSAGLALRRLEGRGKGSAFAYEMTLDTHRYGALIVLDRWSSLVGAFGPHLELGERRAMIAEAPARVAAGERRAMIAEAPARVAAAETILNHANQLIDGSDAYLPELVEACLLAFRAVDQTFGEERTAAERSAALGPMLSEDYKEARRIFLEDLAAR